MKVKDLFKFFFENQGIKVRKNGTLLFKGTCSEFTNKKILEKEVKNVLTLYDGDNYIIINVK